MDRFFAAAGAISAFLAVAAGAFGAHALKEKLPPERLAIFEVGVRYQMYHALALFAVAWLSTRFPGAVISAAGWLFIGGTIVFSGSLYLLAAPGTPRWFGAITPIGGLAFLAGWTCIAIGVMRR